MQRVIYCLLIILLISLSLPSATQAAIVITNVSVSNIVNKSAMLRWRTANEWTRGIVYYGLQADNLDKNAIYSAYQEDHETALIGLEVDKTYYYLILATNQSNQSTQSFIQSFSTTGMKSTIKPSFNIVELVQAVYDVALVRWETDSETRATVQYGKNQDSLNLTAGYGAYEKTHFLSIGSLEPDRYYLRIEAEDRDGNKEYSKLIVFNAYNAPNPKPDLQITNVEPQNYDPQLIFTDRAVIKWQTNYAAKGTIYYGTAPDRLDKSINTASYYPQTAQRVIITDLLPQTTYYYKIKAHTSFYSKEAETKVMSFSTSKEAAAPVTTTLDSDGDTLSDEFELQIGTNPFKSDTDGDGFPDGIEVRNGYNPNGPGKVKGNVYKYGQMRLPLALEQKLAIELKQELQKSIGQLKIASKDWSNFVNAYVYGSYPVKVLAKAAVKYQKQIISPTQSWNDWQKSSTYLNYIDKK